MQNRLIKENKQGVSEENQKLLLELQKQNTLLKEAQDEISNSIAKLKNIDSGIDNLVLLLAKKLKERLIDEFKYLKNNAQKLNLSRILNIVDITTKDGINDILREIKLKILKNRGA